MVFGQPRAAQRNIGDLLLIGHRRLRYCGPSLVRLGATAYSSHHAKDPC